MSAPPSVAVLRGSVRRAVAASTLRSVAAQIGVTHRTVGKFLAGSPPQEKTLRKLRAWYVRHAAENDLINEDTAHAALSLLLAEVSDAEARKRAARELLDVVERAHGRNPPKWLDQLRGKE